MDVSSETCGGLPPEGRELNVGETRINPPLINPENMWGQTTVENCIGGHVKVLSDYKKT